MEHRNAILTPRGLNRTVVPHAGMPQGWGKPSHLDFYDVRQGCADSHTIFHTFCPYCLYGFCLHSSGYTLLQTANSLQGNLLSFITRQHTAWDRSSPPKIIHHLPQTGRQNLHVLHTDGKLLSYLNNFKVIKWGFHLYKGLIFYSHWLILQK